MKPGIFALAFSLLLVIGPAPRVAHASAPKVAFPHNDKLTVTKKDGSKLKLKAPEKAAFLMLLTIDTLEGQCQLFFSKYCTLKELVHGKKTDQGMLGLKVNPAHDEHYKYAVGISGKKFAMSALPRKPGVGGWMWIQGEFSGTCYFNPHGPAIAKKSKKLGGYDFTGIDFSRDAMPGGSEAKW